MFDGSKHLKTRLTLLAALAASGVLVAAPVHAGKELPDVSYDGPTTCNELSSGDFQVEAAFSLDKGKGKWAFVTSLVSVDGGIPVPVDYVATRVQLTDTITPDAVVKPGESVTWTVELVNRKGTMLGKSDRSGTKTCPETS